MGKFEEIKKLVNKSISSVGKIIITLDKRFKVQTHLTKKDLPLNLGPIEENFRGKSRKFEWNDYIVIHKNLSNIRNFVEMIRLDLGKSSISEEGIKLLKEIKDEADNLLNKYHFINPDNQQFLDKLVGMYNKLNTIKYRLDEYPKGEYLFY